MKKNILLPLRRLQRNLYSQTLVIPPPSQLSSPPKACHSLFSSTLSTYTFRNDSFSTTGMPYGSHSLHGSSPAVKRRAGATDHADCVRKIWVRNVHFSLQKRNPSSRGGFFQQMNGRRSFMSTTEVVFGLIGTNVAVYYLWHYVDAAFMAKHFMVVPSIMYPVKIVPLHFLHSLSLISMLVFSGDDNGRWKGSQLHHNQVCHIRSRISMANVTDGRVHTMITSAFSHMNTEHLIKNMIALYFFGNSIGNYFGPRFLLEMYIAGAVTGSIFYLANSFFTARSLKGTEAKRCLSIPGLGASGATNAILLFYIFCFPNSTVFLHFFIPVPAALVGALVIGTDLWRVKQGDKHVSGSCHLGGAFAASVVYAKFIKHWI